MHAGCITGARVATPSRHHHGKENSQPKTMESQQHNPYQPVQMCQSCFRKPQTPPTRWYRTYSTRAWHDSNRLAQACQRSAPRLSACWPGKEEEEGWRIQSMLHSQLLPGNGLGTTRGLAAKAACNEQEVSALGVFRQVLSPKFYCFCYKYFAPAHWFLFSAILARELIRKRGWKHQVSLHPLLKGMLQTSGFLHPSSPP